MSKIFVIGIDGLNNSGKTTQLKRLKENLEARGIYTIIRRGDGSRKGDGKEEFDAYSTWWLENRPRIMAAGFEGKASFDAATEASDRLNRELFLTKNWWIERELKKRGLKQGVILQERGLISRLFVYRRWEPQAGFEEVKYFSNRGRREDVVLPDAIFLLHSSLDVLMSRNPSRVDGIPKQTFNETVLGNYYADFESHMAALPKEIRTRTIVVDSSGTIEQVGERLLEATLQLIQQSRSGIEGNISLGAERK